MASQGPIRVTYRFKAGDDQGKESYAIGMTSAASPASVMSGTDGGFSGQCKARVGDTYSDVLTGLTPGAWFRIAATFSRESLSVCLCLSSEAHCACSLGASHGDLSRCR